jgi:osmotically-inducible protein OsmY
MPRYLPRSVALIGIVGLAVAAVVWRTHRRHEVPAWAAAAASASASAGMAPYTSAPVPDESVASALEELIESDPVLHSRVHVAVADGIVTLSGTVGTVAADWRACRLVSDFRGAVFLVDNLVVGAAERSEADISSDVAGALEGDPATRTARVHAVVSGGRLTLGGTADSYSQRDLVGEVAARVRGVRQVTLTLTVPRAVHRTDAELAASVTDRLREDARLDGTNLTATALGGDAVLAGFVGTLAQRDAALGDATGAGAAKVDARRLKVDSREAVNWRNSLPRAAPTDEALASAVARALSADVTLYDHPPTVRVEKGVVTLSGNVLDFRAARAAGRDASGVSGVQRVDDQATVAPAKWESDATIERQVLRGISDDVEASDARAVHVLTRNGKVTLRGTITSEEDRKVIEEDAEEEPGVVAVQNDLQVVATTTP